MWLIMKIIVVVLLCFGKLKDRRQLYLPREITLIWKERSELEVCGNLQDIMDILKEIEGVKRCVCCILLLKLLLSPGVV